MKGNISKSLEKKYELHDVLLESIKDNLEELKELKEEATSHSGHEDIMYRYYHCSFKVFYIQAYTKEIVKKFQELMPNNKLNKKFLDIIARGTEKEFIWKGENRTNANWEKQTLPLLEAFHHTKYFLEMMIKYGEELDKAPDRLPSGWAAVLYLYNLR